MNVSWEVEIEQKKTWIRVIWKLKNLNWLFRRTRIQFGFGRLFFSFIVSAQQRNVHAFKCDVISKSLQRFGFFFQKKELFNAWEKICLMICYWDIELFSALSHFLLGKSNLIHIAKLHFAKPSEKMAKIAQRWNNDTRKQKGKTFAKCLNRTDALKTTSLTYLQLCHGHLTIGNHWPSPIQQIKQIKTDQTKTFVLVILLDHYK